MAISFVGATQNSTINGGNVTLTLPTLQAGDCVIVAYSACRAITQAVTSSNAAVPYTQIVPAVTNGNLQFAAFRRIVPTAETQAICTGTGNAQDASTAVALVFRGTRVAPPEDVTANSTIGTSTTPDSPAVTLVSSNAVVISAVGSLAVTTAPTAPSSYLNNTSTSASDTRSATTAIAWVTSTNSGSFDPTSWSTFTSAAWASATIALTPASTTWYPQGVDSSLELVGDRRLIKVSDYF